MRLFQKDAISRCRSTFNNDFACHILLDVSCGNKICDRNVELFWTHEKSRLQEVLRAPLRTALNVTAMEKE